MLAAELRELQPLNSRLFAEEGWLNRFGIVLLEVVTELMQSVTGGRANYQVLDT